MQTQLMTEYETKTGVPFTDSLTGLLNHGFLQVYLDREIDRSERYGDPFTLALIDIDSFTQYNKRFGSVEGERVIKEVAGIIMKNLRKVDLAARYSGDVLAVILTNSCLNEKSAIFSVNNVANEYSLNDYHSK
ncbi:MAG: GGDEF domain-containing protein [Desulfobacterales bacterium]|nr:MAG: GGDEF domain-containing protein [Desulfobacterales bacterium]